MSDVTVRYCYGKIGYCDNLDILLWLNTLKPLIEMDVCVMQQIVPVAVENGHLNILQWLYDNGFFNVVFHVHQMTESYTKIFRGALKHGHFDIVTWIVALSSQVTVRKEDIITTCYNGYLEIAQLLYDRDPTLFKDINYVELCQIIIMGKNI